MNYVSCLSLRQKFAWRVVNRMSGPRTIKQFIDQ